jgi:cytochrome oxidase Cu insertion factor (SCO1/SenC/PrrC family)
MIHIFKKPYPFSRASRESNNFSSWKIGGRRMKILKNIALSGFVLFFTACASIPSTRPAGIVENPTPSPVNVAEEKPIWLTVPVTSASSGETFSIDSLNGKVVLVEGMATWCPTCWAQGKEIKTLLDSLNKRSDFVAISLALDTNEDAEALKEYARIGGYTWNFVTSTTPMYRDIGNRYGATYLDPTFSPILIVDKKGKIHNYRKGLIKFDELKSIVKPLLEGN